MLKKIHTLLIIFGFSLITSLSLNLTPLKSVTNQLASHFPQPAVSLLIKTHLLSPQTGLIARTDEYCSKLAIKECHSHPECTVKTTHTSKTFTNQCTPDDCNHSGCNKKIIKIDSGRKICIGHGTKDCTEIYKYQTVCTGSYTTTVKIPHISCVTNPNYHPPKPTSKPPSTPKSNVTCRMSNGVKVESDSKVYYGKDKDGIICKQCGKDGKWLDAGTCQVKDLTYVPSFLRETPVDNPCIKNNIAYGAGKKLGNLVCYNGKFRTPEEIKKLTHVEDDPEKTIDQLKEEAEKTRSQKSCRTPTGLFVPNGESVYGSVHPPKIFICQNGRWEHCQDCKKPTIIPSVFAHNKSEVYCQLGKNIYPPGKLISNNNNDQICENGKWKKYQLDQKKVSDAIDQYQKCLEKPQIPPKLKKILKLGGKSELSNDLLCITSATANLNQYETKSFNNQTAYLNFLQHISQLCLDQMKQEEETNPNPAPTAIVAQCVSNNLQLKLKNQDKDLVAQMIANNPTLVESNLLKTTMANYLVDHYLNQLDILNNNALNTAKAPSTKTYDLDIFKIKLDKLKKEIENNYYLNETVKQKLLEAIKTASINLKQLTSSVLTKNRESCYSLPSPDQVQECLLRYQAPSDQTNKNISPAIHNSNHTGIYVKQQNLTTDQQKQYQTVIHDNDVFREISSKAKRLQQIAVYQNQTTNPEHTTKLGQQLATNIQDLLNTIDNQDTKTEVKKWLAQKDETTNTSLNDVLNQFNTQPFKSGQNSSRLQCLTSCAGTCVAVPSNFNPNITIYRCVVPDNYLKESSQSATLTIHTPTSSNVCGGPNQQPCQQNGRNECDQNLIFSPKTGLCVLDETNLKIETLTKALANSKETLTATDLLNQLQQYSRANNLNFNDPQTQQQLYTHLQTKLTNTQNCPPPKITTIDPITNKFVCTSYQEATQNLNDEVDLLAKTDPALQGTQPGDLNQPCKSTWLGLKHTCNSDSLTCQDGICVLTQETINTLALDKLNRSNPKTTKLANIILPFSKYANQKLIESKCNQTNTYFTHEETCYLCLNGQSHTSMPVSTQLCGNPTFQAAFTQNLPDKQCKNLGGYCVDNSTYQHQKSNFTQLGATCPADYTCVKWSGNQQTTEVLPSGMYMSSITLTYKGLNQPVDPQKHETCQPGLTDVNGFCVDNFTAAFDPKRYSPEGENLITSLIKPMVSGVGSLFHTGDYYRATKTQAEFTQALLQNIWKDPQLKHVDHLSSDIYEQMYGPSKVQLTKVIADQQKPSGNFYYQTLSSISLATHAWTAGFVNSLTGHDNTTTSFLEYAKAQSLLNSTGAGVAGYKRITQGKVGAFGFETAFALVDAATMAKDFVAKPLIHVADSTLIDAGHMAASDFLRIKISNPTGELIFKISEIPIVGSPLKFGGGLFSVARGTQDGFGLLLKSAIEITGLNRLASNTLARLAGTAAKDIAQTTIEGGVAEAGISHAGFFRSLINTGKDLLGFLPNPNLEEARQIIEENGGYLSAEILGEKVTDNPKLAKPLLELTGHRDLARVWDHLPEMDKGTKAKLIHILADQSDTALQLGPKTKDAFLEFLKGRGLNLSKGTPEQIFHLLDHYKSPLVSATTLTDRQFAERLVESGVLSDKSKALALVRENLNLAGTDINLRKTFSLSEALFSSAETKEIRAAHKLALERMAKRQKLITAIITEAGLEEEKTAIADNLVRYFPLAKKEDLISLAQKIKASPELMDDISGLFRGELSPVDFMTKHDRETFNHVIRTMAHSDQEDPGQILLRLYTGHLIASQENFELGKLLLNKETGFINTDQLLQRITEIHDLPKEQLAQIKLALAKYPTLLNETIANYDGVMRLAGELPAFDKIVTESGQTLERGIKETAADFYQRVAKARLENPEAFVPGKIKLFSEEQEVGNSLFSWLNTEEKPQANVILQALFTPNTNIVKAYTGIGKTKVIIPTLALIQQRLTGKPITLVFATERDQKAFMELFRYASSLFPNVKPLELANLHNPAKNILSQLGKSNFFVTNSEVIFASLEDRGLNRKITSALTNSILIGDEAHLSLSLDNQYIRAIGEPHYISYQKASRFNQLFLDPLKNKDDQFAQLFREHTEALAAGKPSPLLKIDSETGKLVLSSETETTLYQHLLDNWNREFPHLNLPETVGDDLGEFRSTIATIIGATDDNLAKDQVLDDLSMLDSVKKVLSDTPDNGFGIGKQPLPNGQMEKMVTPFDSGHPSGKQYSSVYDKLAYQGLGEAILNGNAEKAATHLADLAQTARLVVTPKALETNYGLYFPEIFSRHNSLMFTGTPELIAKQWETRFGIQTSLIGGNDEIVKRVLTEKLGNRIYSVSDLASLDFSTLREETGKELGNLKIVVAAHQIPNETAIDQLVKKSPSGYDTVFVVKSDGTIEYITGNVKGKINSLAELNRTQKELTLQGKKFILIYSEGTHYGTDLASWPSDTFVHLYDSSSTLTDFVQSLGRDRAKKGAATHVAFFLGVKEPIDSFDKAWNFLAQNEARQIRQITLQDIGGEVKNGGYRFIKELELRNQGLNPKVFAQLRDAWREVADSNPTIGSEAVEIREYLARDLERYRAFIAKLSKDKDILSQLSPEAREYLQRVASDEAITADAIKFATEKTSVKPLADAITPQELLASIEHNFTASDLPETISKGANLTADQAFQTAQFQKAFQEALAQQNFSSTQAVANILGPKASYLLTARLIWHGIKTNFSIKHPLKTIGSVFNAIQTPFSPHAQLAIYLYSHGLSASSLQIDQLVQAQQRYNLSKKEVKKLASHIFSTNQTPADIYQNLANLNAENPDQRVIAKLAQETGIDKLTAQTQLAETPESPTEPVKPQPEPTSQPQPTEALKPPTQQVQTQTQTKTKNLVNTTIITLQTKGIPAGIIPKSITTPQTLATKLSSEAFQKALAQIDDPQKLAQIKTALENLADQLDPNQYQDQIDTIKKVADSINQNLASVKTSKTIDNTQLSAPNPKLLLPLYKFVEKHPLVSDIIIVASTLITGSIALYLLSIQHTAISKLILTFSRWSILIISSLAILSIVLANIKPTSQPQPTEAPKPPTQQVQTQEKEVKQVAQEQKTPTSIQASSLKPGQIISVTTEHGSHYQFYVIKNENGFVEVVEISETGKLAGEHLVINANNVIAEGQQIRFAGGGCTSSITSLDIQSASEEQKQVAETILETYQGLGKINPQDLIDHLAQTQPDNLHQAAYSYITQQLGLDSLTDTQKQIIDQWFKKNHPIEKAEGEIANKSARTNSANQSTPKAKIKSLIDGLTSSKFAKTITKFIKTALQKTHKFILEHPIWQFIIGFIPGLLVFFRGSNSIEFIRKHIWKIFPSLAESIHNLSYLASYLGILIILANLSLILRIKFRYNLQHPPLTQTSQQTVILNPKEAPNQRILIRPMFGTAWLSKHVHYTIAPGIQAKIYYDPKEEAWFLKKPPVKYEFESNGQISHKDNGDLNLTNVTSLKFHRKTLPIIGKLFQKSPIVISLTISVDPTTRQLTLTPANTNQTPPTPPTPTPSSLTPLWTQKSLAQNYKKYLAQLEQFRQQLNLDLNTYQTRVNRFKTILSQLPLVTSRNLTAVQAIAQGKPLLAAKYLPSSQTHTSITDKERRLDEYVFASHGRPYDLFNGRYGSYHFILNPNLLQQPTTIVTPIDIAEYGLNLSQTERDNLIRQTALRGSDYIDFLARIFALVYDNENQFLGETLPDTNVPELNRLLQLWQAPIEIKIKDKVLPKKILGLIVPKENFSNISSLDLPFPVYSMEQVFGLKELHEYRGSKHLIHFKQFLTQQAQTIIIKNKLNKLNPQDLINHLAQTQPDDLHQAAYSHIAQQLGLDSLTDTQKQIIDQWLEKKHILELAKQEIEKQELTVPSLSPTSQIKEISPNDDELKEFIQLIQAERTSGVNISEGEFKEFQSQQPTDRKLYLIFDSNNRPVGGVIVTQEGFVPILLVLKQARKSGYASKLLSFIKSNYEQINLFASAKDPLNGLDQQKLIEFYLKHGFIPIKNKNGSNLRFRKNWLEYYFQTQNPRKTAQKIIDSDNFIRLSIEDLVEIISKYWPTPQPTTSQPQSPKISPKPSSQPTPLIFTPQGLQWWLEHRVNLQRLFQPMAKYAKLQKASNIFQKIIDRLGDPIEHLNPKLRQQTKDLVATLRSQYKFKLAHNISNADTLIKKIKSDQFKQHFQSLSPRQQGQVINLLKKYAKNIEETSKLAQQEAEEVKEIAEEEFYHPTLPNLNWLEAQVATGKIDIDKTQRILSKYQFQNPNLIILPTDTFAHQNQSDFEAIAKQILSESESNEQTVSSYAQAAITLHRFYYFYRQALNLERSNNALPSLIDLIKQYPHLFLSAVINTSPEEINTLYRDLYPSSPNESLSEKITILVKDYFTNLKIQSQIDKKSKGKWKILQRHRIYKKIQSSTSTTSEITPPTPGQNWIDYLRQNKYEYDSNGWFYPPTHLREEVHHSIADIDGLPISLTYKLHFSISPQTSISVAKKVLFELLTFLQQNNIDHKVADNYTTNSHKQGGKTLTIYLPPNKETIEAIVAKVKDLTQKYNLSGTTLQEAKEKQLNLQYELPIPDTNSTLYYTIEHVADHYIGDPDSSLSLVINNIEINLANYEERVKAMDYFWGYGPLDHLWPNNPTSYQVDNLVKQYEQKWKQAGIPEWNIKNIISSLQELKDPQIIQTVASKVLAWKQAGIDGYDIGWTIRYTAKNQNGLSKEDLVKKIEAIIKRAQKVEQLIDQLIQTELLAENSPFVKAVMENDDKKARTIVLQTFEKKGITNEDLKILFERNGITGDTDKDFEIFLIDIKSWALIQGIIGSYSEWKKIGLSETDIIDIVNAFTNDTKLIKGIAIHISEWKTNGIGLEEILNIIKTLTLQDLQNRSNAEKKLKTIKDLSPEDRQFVLKTLFDEENSQQPPQTPPSPPHSSSQPKTNLFTRIVNLFKQLLGKVIPFFAAILLISFAVTQLLPIHASPPPIVPPTTTPIVQTVEQPEWMNQPPTTQIAPTPIVTKTPPSLNQPTSQQQAPATTSQSVRNQQQPQQQKQNSIQIIHLKTDSPYPGYATSRIASNGGRIFIYSQQEYLPISPNDLPPHQLTETRSAKNLKSIISWFNIEKSGRYQPTSGITFCNIWAWDSSRALGVELPRYYNGQKTNANWLYLWLTGEGKSQWGWSAGSGANLGWHEVSPQKAQELANQGQPVYAIIYNPNGPGHIALVRPGEGITVDNVFYPDVANVGRVVSENINAYKAFQGFLENPTVPEQYKHIRYFTNPNRYKLNNNYDQSSLPTDNNSSSFFLPPFITTFLQAIATRRKQWILDIHNRVQQAVQKVQNLKTKLKLLTNPKTAFQSLFQQLQTRRYQRNLLKKIKKNHPEEYKQYFQEIETLINIISQSAKPTPSNIVNLAKLLHSNPNYQSIIVTYLQSHPQDYKLDNLIQFLQTVSQLPQNLQSTINQHLKTLLNRYNTFNLNQIFTLLPQLPQNLQSTIISQITNPDTNIDLYNYRYLLLSLPTDQNIPSFVLYLLPHLNHHYHLASESNASKTINTLLNHTEDFAQHPELLQLTIDYLNSQQKHSINLENLERFIADTTKTLQNKRNQEKRQQIEKDLQNIATQATNSPLPENILQLPKYLSLDDLNQIVQQLNATQNPRLMKIAKLIQTQVINHLNLNNDSYFFHNLISIYPQIVKFLKPEIVQAYLKNPQLSLIHLLAWSGDQKLFDQLVDHYVLELPIEKQQIARQKLNNYFTFIQSAKDNPKIYANLYNHIDQYLYYPTEEFGPIINYLKKLSSKDLETLDKAFRYLNPPQLSLSAVKNILYIQKKIFELYLTGKEYIIYPYLTSHHPNLFTQPNPSEADILIAILDAVQNAQYRKHSTSKPSTIDLNNKFFHQLQPYLVKHYDALKQAARTNHSLGLFVFLVENQDLINSLPHLSPTNSISLLKITLRHQQNRLNLANILSIKPQLRSSIEKLFFIPNAYLLAGYLNPKEVISILTNAEQIISLFKYDQTSQTWHLNSPLSKLVQTYLNIKLNHSLIANIIIRNNNQLHQLVKNLSNYHSKAIHQYLTQQIISNDIVTHYDQIINQTIEIFTQYSQYLPKNQEDTIKILAHADLFLTQFPNPSSINPLNLLLFYNSIDLSDQTLGQILIQIDPRFYILTQNSRLKPLIQSLGLTLKQFIVHHPNDQQGLKKLINQLAEEITSTFHEGNVNDVVLQKMWLLRRIPEEKIASEMNIIANANPQVAQALASKSPIQVIQQVLTETIIQSANPRYQRFLGPNNPHYQQMNQLRYQLDQYHRELVEQIESTQTPEEKAKLIVPNNSVSQRGPHSTIPFILEEGLMPDAFINAETWEEKANSPLTSEVATTRPHIQGKQAISIPDRLANFDSDHGGKVNIIAVIPQSDQLRQPTYLEGKNKLGPAHQYVFSGIPSSYIHTLVLDPQEDDLEFVKQAVAANGWYIPVYDYNGNLLLSPEEFDTLRAIYYPLYQLGYPTSVAHDVFAYYQQAKNGQLSTKHTTVLIKAVDAIKEQLQSEPLSPTFKPIVNLVSLVTYLKTHPLNHHPEKWYQQTSIEEIIQSLNQQSIHQTIALSRELNQQPHGFIQHFIAQLDFIHQQTTQFFSHLKWLLFRRLPEIGLRSSSLPIAKIRQLAEFTTQQRINLFQKVWEESWSALAQNSNLDPEQLNQYRQLLVPVVSGSMGRYETLLGSDLDYEILVDDSQLPPNLSIQQLAQFVNQILTPQINAILVKFNIVADDGLAKQDATPFTTISSIKKLQINIKSNRQTVEPTVILTYYPIYPKDQPVVQKARIALFSTDISWLSTFLSKDLQRYTRRLKNSLNNIVNSNEITDIKYTIQRPILFKLQLYLIQAYQLGLISQEDIVQAPTNTWELIDFLYQHHLITQEEKDTFTQSFATGYYLRYLAELFSPEGRQTQKLLKVKIPSLPLSHLTYTEIEIVHYNLNKLYHTLFLTPYRLIQKPNQSTSSPSPRGQINPGFAASLTPLGLLAAKLSGLNLPLVQPFIQWSSHSAHWLFANTSTLLHTLTQSLISSPFAAILPDLPRLQPLFKTWFHTISQTHFTPATIFHYLNPFFPRPPNSEIFLLVINNDKFAEALIDGKNTKEIKQIIIDIIKERYPNSNKTFIKQSTDSIIRYIIKWKEAGFDEWDIINIINILQTAQKQGEKIQEIVNSNLLQTLANTIGVNIEIIQSWKEAGFDEWNIINIIKDLRGFQNPQAVADQVLGWKRAGFDEWNIINIIKGLQEQPLLMELLNNNVPENKIVQFIVNKIDLNIRVAKFLRTILTPKQKLELYRKLVEKALTPIDPTNIDPNQINTYPLKTIADVVNYINRDSRRPAQSSKKENGMKLYLIKKENGMKLYLVIPKNPNSPASDAYFKLESPPSKYEETYRKISPIIPEFTIPLTQEQDGSLREDFAGSTLADIGISFGANYPTIGNINTARLPQKIGLRIIEQVKVIKFILDLQGINHGHAHDRNFNVRFEIINPENNEERETYYDLKQAVEEAQKKQWLIRPIVIIRDFGLAVSLSQKQLTINSILNQVINKLKENSEKNNIAQEWLTTVQPELKSFGFENTKNIRNLENLIHYLKSKDFINHFNALNPQQKGKVINLLRQLTTNHSHQSSPSTRGQIKLGFATGLTPLGLLAAKHGLIHQDSIYQYTNMYRLRTYTRLLDTTPNFILNWNHYEISAQNHFL